MAYQVGDEIHSGKHGSLRVEKLLNTGAFAEAYHVKVNGSDFFFKKYTDPSTLFTPWFGEYHTYQGEVLNRLESPAVKPWIVPVLDAFIFDDFYCQVHQWNANPDVAEIIKSFDLWKESDREAALHLARLFVYAMKCIHEAGIVHTDLKPENIAVESGRDGKLVPRVADFDWSLIAGRQHPWEGGVRGTPFYMSYEHMYGGKVDSTSDIFTCGIILYEILAGVHPVKHVLPAGDHSLDELHGHLRPIIDSHGSFPTPLELNPKCGLWPGANEVLHACMAPQPSARPTIADVHRILLSKACILVLRHGNGFELRTTRQDVESQHCYLGRERCRMFGNYKEISRLHAWLMPSPDMTKWFAVPPQHPSTNILTVEKNGREERLAGSHLELEDGDKVRIRGAKDFNYVVAEWTVELRPE